MIPGPRLRQRSAGGEGARAERPAPPAPAAAGGGSAASRRARDKSRWPLLPGCWSDGPDADRKAWMACSFDRVLNAFCLLLHGVTQVASLLHWSSLPGDERFQRVLSIFVCLGLLLLPCCTPAWYDRWRKEVLVAFRLIFFAFPLLRKPRGIQKVLDDEPQPGARGALKDALKLAWGCRLLAVILATILNPLPQLPLVPHLLLQLYSVRANATICAAPMLTHPLFKQRIRTFHSAMHLLAFVLPGGVGQSMFPLLMRNSRPHAECEAFLTLFQFSIGLLLPILVLLKTEPPHSLRAWDEACAARRAGATASDSGGQQQRQRSVLADLEHWLEAAVRGLCGRSWLAPPLPTEEEQAALMRMQQELTGVRPPGPLRLRLRGWERLIAWWLVIACSWALSMAVSAH